MSHSNKNVAESLSTTVYAVPIAMINPYLAGGIFADYLVHGRPRLVPRDVHVLSSDDLSGLTGAMPEPQTSRSAGIQAPAAADEMAAPVEIDEATDPGQKE